MALILRGNGTVEGMTSAPNFTPSSMPAGSSVQVVQTTNKDQLSFTMLDLNNGYTNYGLNENGFDVTQLDTSITPSSTSNKILITVNICFWAQPASYGVFRLKRGIGGATPAYSASDPWMASMNTVPGTLAQMGSVGISTNGDTNWYARTLNFHWLDSPNTTSAVTYRMNFRMEGDNGSQFWVNRAGYNTNDYGANTGTSSVILTEIAG